MRILTVLALVSLNLNALKAADAVETYWPLAKGNYWVYEGDITFVSTNPATDKNDIVEKHVTWNSEVREVLQNQDFTVAWLHGFPLELTWADDKTQPGDLLMVQIGTDYYRITGENIPTFFEKLKTAGADWSTCYQELEQAELFLPVPLVADKRFGGTPGNLISGRYCKLVEASSPFDLAGVKGAPKIEGARSFDISSLSNPENSDIGFVPGLGITSYYYHHHGTAMDVSVHLIEFGHAK